ncbi:GNAT family N-acetyltransferase [Epilithonimonas ginsengisoli]|uniref:GNAT family N-acetyltransferase n=1 Tax=Epilithonimonas ginsengisoli TaxID=1245592 RepID=A0ABU4JEI5_9FLAO|nr:MULTISPECIES: GNAT family N-acetyltransferase [Chryseobacterium group]MBV6879453.1 GNAT family N-acetyltransferase [Epilithonimonas sp. FP105]MDW8548089.1 GNAT family N-acetyltransferase [Epilithonimonas ginsengisoli]OAH64471.1 GNAT family acetyltransferase [Chryseobacterium sp. FP211-J200]
MKNYETERLILKPAALEDADFFLKLYNLPSFIKFIGDKNLRTKEDAEKYITNRFLPQIDKLGFGNYVVIHKKLNEKIGAVGVFVREGIDVPDIGFSFFPDFEGKGYAYESAVNLMEIVKTEFGVEKLSAMTSDENISSQKLIERLGLQFKKYVIFPDDNEELRYYEN